ncbi:hypothetical protein D9613_008399 [Agrocybe pediades]|uniref:Uncharacterized protein n=1 Tax=Agrocybe pediades TaxID=84607 RepID=A0A8H4QU57_9AGAR|nr:hypothetical protein D9613_008399 [Agrocybe pediades]
MYQNKRSSTLNHTLLSASRPHLAHACSRTSELKPTRPLLTWTLGRGSVIWRIWPAVVLHTAFAACIVVLDLRRIINLELPNVMLTVLGVVIGFVISYRASTGYDRYWTGRTCWSDIMRNSRTLGRLVWFHVPLRTGPKAADPPNEVQDLEVKRKVMNEKVLALDLIEGFSVALKHHIRGELGIYYEDLYHLVKPLHGYMGQSCCNSPATATPTALPSRTTQNVPAAQSEPPKDPHIPPINAYGTFHSEPESHSSAAPHIRFLMRSNQHDNHDHHQPLLPSVQPPPRAVVSGVDGDLIPFPFSSLLRRIFSSGSSEMPASPQSEGRNETNDPELVAGRRRRRVWRASTIPHPTLHSKHRPKVAGGGENLPLEILRCLSEWLSVLEERGCVPGSSVGPMIAAIAAFEESLTALEKILTTPLPFVYAVHISTVWLYLFFLPFQLVSQFQYYTIPGVAIASFIYLGFLAAGEEIEQPFGYDDNDLDLDLFCHSIIHADIQQLKRTQCLNAYFDYDTDFPSISEHAGRQQEQTYQRVSEDLALRRSLTLSEVSNLQARMRQMEDREGVSSGLGRVSE